MNYENIPEELKRLDQWVCADNYSKAPLKAFEMGSASSTDKSTWTDFETALSTFKRAIYPYLGFVFADNGYVGIDIDAGYDEDGFISLLGADIIDHCRSYTEKSKSGRGFHIVLKGDLPFKGKNNLNGVEIYKTARYFIMTGNVVLFSEIVENQEAIDYVLEKYFPETVREGNGGLGVDKIYHPIYRKPTEHNIQIRPTYPRIPDGCRNLSLTSLAGAMHTTGYSKEQIYDELVIANEEACDPPLKKSELRTICNSITRYRR